MKPIRDWSNSASVDFARITDQLEMKLESMILHEIHNKIQTQLVWNIGVTVFGEIYLDERF